MEDVQANNAAGWLKLCTLSVCWLNSCTSAFMRNAEAGHKKTFGKLRDPTGILCLVHWAHKKISVKPSKKKCLIFGLPRRCWSLRLSLRVGSLVKVSTMSCLTVISAKSTRGCFSHTCKPTPTPLTYQQTHRQTASQTDRQAHQDDRLCTVAVLVGDDLECQIRNRLLSYHNAQTYTYLNVVKAQRNMHLGAVKRGL